MLKPGQTTYSVVVGKNTPFGPGKGKSLDDFDMNLILVVERNQPVCWMAPASDLTESVALQGINWQNSVDEIGSPHPTIVNIGHRNGSVRSVTQSIEPRVLQDLLEGTAQEYLY